MGYEDLSNTEQAPIGESPITGDTPTYVNPPPLVWGKEEAAETPAPVQGHIELFKQLNESYKGLSAQASQWVKTGIDYRATEYKEGVKGVARSHALFDAWSGHKNYNDVERDFSADKLNYVESQGIDPINYYLGAGAGMLPSVIEGGKAGIAGAAAALGLAADAGQVEPHELAAVAIGGFTGVSALYATKQGIGTMYGALKEQGLDDSIAKPGALIGGVIDGAISLLKIGSLGGAVQEEISKRVAERIGTGLFRQTVASVVKQAATQGALSGTQVIADEATKAVADIAAGKPGLIPKKEEWMQKAAEGIKQGVIAGSQFGGLTHGFSYGFNKVMAGHMVDAVLAPPEEAKLDTNKPMLEGRVETKVSAQLAPSVSYEEAKEKHAEAKTKLGQINGQIIDHVNLNENVPNELKQQLADAREEVKNTKYAKDRAEYAATKADINAQLEKPSLAEAERTKLEGQLDAAKQKLQAMKAKAVEEDATAKEKEIVRKLRAETERLKTNEAAKKAYIEKQRQANKGKVKQKHDFSIQDKAEQEHPTKGATERIEKLKAKLDEIRSVKGMVKTGTISTADLHKLHAEINATVSTNLLNRTISKTVSGIKRLKGAITKDIDNSRNLLNKLVAQSDLSAASKLKLKGHIDKVTDASQLKEAAGQIEQAVNDLLEKEDKKEALSTLRKAVAPIKTKGTESVFSQNIQTKYDKDATIQDALTLFKLYVEHKEEVTKVEDQYFKAAASGQLSQQIEFKFGVAQEVGDLAHKTSDEVFKLAADINHLKKGGLKGKLQEKEQFQEKLHAKQSTLLAGVQGDSPVDLTPTGSEERLPTALTPTKKAVKSHGLTMADFNGMVRKLVQDTKGKANREKIVQDLSLDVPDRKVGNLIREENTNLLNEVQKATNLSARKILLLRAGLEKRLYAKDPVTGKPTKKDVVYKNKNGVNTKFKGTRAEAAYYVSAFHDVSLQDGLHKGNEFTFEGHNEEGVVDTTQAKLEEALTDDEKNYIKGVVNYYQKAFEKIREEYKKETGFELSKEDFYSGLAKRRGKAGEGSSNLVDDIDASFNGYMQGRIRTHASQTRVNQPNSFRPRVPNSRAVMPVSITANVLNSIDKNSRWLVMHESDVKLNAYAWQNTDINTALSRKFGHEAPGHMAQAVKDTINGRSRYATGVIKGITQFMADAGGVMFTCDITRGLRHVATHLYVLYDVPWSDYVEGTLDYQANPKKWAELLSQSPVFNKRYVDYREEYGGQGIRQGAFQHPYAADLEHVLWGFFAVGAKEADLWGGAVMYKYTLKQTKSPEAAMKAFEDYLEHRQFSKSPTASSELSRNPNTGWLGAWQNIPLKVYQRQLESYTNLVHSTPSELPGNAADFAKTTAVTATAGVIFHGIATAWQVETAKDQKQRDQAVFTLETRTIAELLSPPPLQSFATYGVGMAINKGQAGLAERMGTEKPEKFDLPEPNQFAIAAGVDLAKLAGNLTGQVMSGKVGQKEVYGDIKEWLLSGNVAFGKVPAAPVRGLLDLTKHPDESAESKSIKL